MCCRSRSYARRRDAARQPKTGTPGGPDHDRYGRSCRDRLPGVRDQCSESSVVETPRTGGAGPLATHPPARLRRNDGEDSGGPGRAGPYRAARRAGRRAGASRRGGAREVPVGGVDQWREEANVPAAREPCAGQQHAHGMFFLQKPPQIDLPVPDFRTVGDGDVPVPSQDLLHAIHLMQRRQGWFRDCRATTSWRLATTRSTSATPA